MKTTQQQYTLTNAQREAINNLLVGKYGVEYAISEVVNGGISNLVEIRLQNGMKFEINKSEVDELLNTGTAEIRVEYIKNQINNRIKNNNIYDEARNKSLGRNPK